MAEGSSSEENKELSPMDEEEKEKLIGEILELQNTLHDLSQRVSSVKEENEQLKADNQVSTASYNYHGDTHVLEQ